MWRGRRSGVIPGPRNFRVIIKDGMIYKNTLR
jgi:hypothetical protein